LWRLWWQGVVCRTNTPSTTSLRAPGVTQVCRPEARVRPVAVVCAPVPLARVYQVDRLRGWARALAAGCVCFTCCCPMSVVGGCLLPTVGLIALDCGHVGHHARGRFSCASIVPCFFFQITKCVPRVYCMPGVFCVPRASHVSHVCCSFPVSCVPMQAVFSMETIVDDAAATLGMDPLHLRHANFLRPVGCPCLAPFAFRAHKRWARRLRTVV
jgi:hypothetical protein